MERKLEQPYTVNSTFHTHTIMRRGEPTPHKFTTKMQADKIRDMMNEAWKLGVGETHENYF